MSANLNTVLREIHRCRRHARDLKSEIDGLPRVKKAHQAKIAKQEALLKEAQDAVKQVKAANNDREVDLKATYQLLVKYERQLNDMSTPKEVEAKQTEIANAKIHVAQLEEDILIGLGEIDDRVAKVPAVDEQLKKARSDFAAFEADTKEREERLQREMKLAQAELQKVEAEVPTTVRPYLDRMVKAHGPDSLASVKVKERSCSQCLTSVTVHAINELLSGHFSCCNNCGRLLYLDE